MRCIEIWQGVGRLAGRALPGRGGGLLCLLALCSVLAWGDCQAQPTVYTVNYPLQYFAERIGGGQVNVVFPAPPDVDPAFWAPDVDEIASFQAADLIFLNGATYAKWLKTASLPKSKLIDTSRRFEADFIEVEDTGTHSHGPAGEHSHGGTAFTTWLDFRQAVQQAQAVTEGLSRLLPVHRESFEERYAELERDLTHLDDQLRAIAERAAGRPLLASHPVYQYLARRYGLDMESVMWEPDAAPDDGQWRELESILERHAAGWMLWEGHPLPAVAQRLEALGVQSLVFDPCGNKPEEGDFLSVMRRNLATLGQAFQ